MPKQKKNWVRFINFLLKSKIVHRDKNIKDNPRKDWLNKAIMISCHKRERLYTQKRNELNNDKVKFDNKKSSNPIFLRLLCRTTNHNQVSKRNRRKRGQNPLMSDEIVQKPFE